MLIRPRLRLIAALALALPAAAGCTSGNRIAGGLASFPWVVTSDVPGSRDALKNPSQLDLSYAQWQEQLGNLPEAEQSYKRVLESDPKSLDANLGLARLAQLGGHSEAAEAAYLAVVKADPDNALALDALGQFYAAGHRWTDAVATLARATELAPDDGTTRNHYAVALARSGDFEAALTQFSRAVGEAEGYYNVGYILYEQGQITAAEQAFRKAIAIRPDLTSAQMMLAEIRRDSDDTAPIAQNSRPALPQAVTQTAASSQSGWNQAVTPASAVAAQSPPQVAEAPSIVQPASSTTATVPVAPISPPEATAALPAQDLPRWEMPTQREPALLSAEQIEARSATP